MKVEEALLCVCALEDEEEDLLREEEEDDLPLDVVFLFDDVFLFCAIYKISVT